MFEKTRRFVALVLALSVFAAPIANAEGVVDERPGFGEMLVDGVIVRPLGIGATIIGGATWLITLPFSALGGNVGDATEKMVIEPFQFTFARPLGEF